MRIGRAWAGRLENFTISQDGFDWFGIHSALLREVENRLDLAEAVFDIGIRMAGVQDRIMILGNQVGGEFSNRFYLDMPCEFLPEQSRFETLMLGNPGLALVKVADFFQSRRRLG